MSSAPVVWRGRPWIVPLAAARTLALIAVLALFIPLEIEANIANDVIAGITLLWWTVIVFFVIWLIIMGQLLWERASNLYTLRSDSLEIRTGIFTVRSFVVVPSGFSDLEVVEGVWGRMTGYGNIIIRTQSERDGQRILLRIRHPKQVASQIRDVLGKSIVRLAQP
jgi:membrane protein YdbS with pleckstrin-like domain